MTASYYVMKHGSCQRIRETARMVGSGRSATVDCMWQIQETFGASPSVCGRGSPLALIAYLFYPRTLPGQAVYGVQTQCLQNLSKLDLVS